jgi:hypothetical protein
MRIPVPGEGLKLFGTFRPHQFVCAICFEERDSAIEAVAHIKSHRGCDLVTRLRAKGTFERQLASPPKTRCSVSTGHDLHCTATPCSAPAVKRVPLYKGDAEEDFVWMCKEHSAEGWHLNIGD